MPRSTTDSTSFVSEELSDRGTVDSIIDKTASPEKLRKSAFLSVVQLTSLWKSWKV